MKINELPFSEYLRFLFSNPQLLAVSPWSKDRIRKDVARWIRLAKVTSGKVLDIGCGFGLHAARFSELGFFVTAIERYPEFYFFPPQAWQIPQKNLNFIFDEFPKGIYGLFDLILVNNNFVIFDQIPNAIEEMNKRLVENGKVVIDLSANHPIFNKAKQIEHFELFPNGKIVNHHANETIFMKEYEMVSYSKYLESNSEKIEFQFVANGFAFKRTKNGFIATKK